MASLPRRKVLHLVRHGHSTNNLAVEEAMKKHGVDQPQAAMQGMLGSEVQKVSRPESALTAI